MEDYDKFMEVCMGHHGQIVLDTDFNIRIEQVNDDNIFEHIDNFNQILDHIRDQYENELDLLNIIDEMEANLNRLVYLLELK